VQATFVHRRAIIPSGDRHETAQESWDRENANWMAVATNNISLGSEDTYGAGIRAFQTWCRFKAIDPTLRVQSTLYDKSKATAPYEVCTMGCFLSWLAFDRKVAPGTTRVYRCGVRHYLRTCFVDVRFFEHEALGCLDAGLAIQWRATHEGTTSVKLPFTVEMWKVMQRKVVGTRDPMDQAASTAVTMGLVMLLRCSELIVGAANHFFRGKDVSFVMKNTTTSGEQDVFVTPNDAHLYDLTNLKGVSCLIRSAKNDQDGEGHRCTFETQTVSERHAFCVATIMFAWAQRARPKSDEPFLSYRGEASLSYDKYTGVIKRAAFQSGFDPARFSSHSVRIGGASSLAAAGFDNYYIMLAGRWKSLAFLDYIRRAVGAMAAAQRAISNPESYSNHDLRTLHPKAVL
jgi:hypothetical protein